MKDKNMLTYGIWRKTTLNHISYQVLQRTIIKTKNIV